MRTGTYRAKVAAGAGLVALGDALFDGDGMGAALGLFALAWAVVLAVTRPSVRKRAAGRALFAATAFALVLVDDPSLLGWSLFWCAISLAALLPRHGFDDAFAWARRLVLHAALGLGAPLCDWRRVLRTRRRDDARGLRALAAVLALPVIGGAVFLALFARANPLIGDAFAQVALPDAWTTISHLALWAAILLVVWPSFRPLRLATARWGDDRPMPGRICDVPLATLTLSLVTFNAVFALENVLDIVFLWSGAALPDKVTMADYAHRGAYSLIATALLAALFVLVALRPGSAGERSPLVRWLVALWIAQNLLLVASSMLRTVDYVQAYSLTVLRLSALAWMALVAAGLALIGWRLLGGRTAAWLINANAVAATLVLAVASVVDLGASAAAWNVAHAPEAGGQGPALDLCYLDRLGPSALVPIIVAERRVHDPAMRDGVTFLRAKALRELMESQADWQRWTWRGARRLDRARAMLGEHTPVPLAAPNGRGCGGAVIPPPPPPPTPPLTPLTGAPER